MGLFSGSKKIYVSSTVYNLAGEEADRPNFLKSTIFSAVMNRNDVYLGEIVVGNYLKGPGILQRSFFNYAVRNDLGGLPTFSIRNSVTIDPDVVKPYIPVPSSPANLETRVQSAELTDGDFTFWAEQYMLDNHPTLFGSDWVSDYDEDANEITIQFEDGSTEEFTATGFDKDQQFIISNFYQVVAASEQSLVTGSLTEDVTSLPDLTGFTLDSTTNTGVVSHTLNQTVEVTTEYSNGDPDDVNTTTPTTVIDYNGNVKIYSRVDYTGGDGTSQETQRVERTLRVWELREVTVSGTGTTETVVNDVGGGETETVTTVTTGDFLTPIYDHREDTQITILENVVGGAGIFIYEIGSGNATLDALQSVTSPGGDPEYYPFLPIRLNNTSINAAAYDDNTGSGLYQQTNRAYRRASKNQSFSKLVEQVEDNDDLADIDYAYVQWGVSVNVIEPACRRYMYEFFKGLIPFQNTSETTITNIKAGVNSYTSAVATLNAWTAAQSDSSHALYGTTRPTLPNIGYPDSTTIRLVSDDAQLGGFDNRYTWVTVSETSHNGTRTWNNGVTTIPAVAGTIWFEKDETFSWNVSQGVGGVSAIASPRAIQRTFMYKMTSDNTYTRLSIWGMVHNNYIYGGKAVTTTMWEAIDDATASVFIIPLHAPTVKALGIKDFTQMATANTWITFSSYQVVKTRWYESFLGMLLIIIAIVAISALISPGAVGAASGAFGTNLAVGTGLGLSGTAAVVAGAVTNALAAIIITQAVSELSTSLFGEKWGAIIGAIVGFAINLGMQQGFSSMGSGTLLSPKNILGFGNALANGYQGFVQAEIMEINEEKLENQDVYDKSVRDLEAMMRAQGLTNDLLFNPIVLTDTAQGNDNSSSGSYTPESMDQFINRTTMTGGDVVDITLSMVSEYSDLQLTLPKS